MDQLRAWLHDIAHQYLDPEMADRAVSLAEPGARLVPVADGTPAPGRSRFGGLPLLDPGTPWPTCYGKPLRLLAVIDLAELPECDSTGLLPRTGLLNVFLAADIEVWITRPELWRIVPAGPGAVERAATEQTLTFPALPLRLVPSLTLPSAEEEGVVEALGLSGDLYTDEATWDAVKRYYEVGAVLHNRENNENGVASHAPIHRIGGWPDALQAPPYYHADQDSGSAGEAADWRLLFQIDTDDDLGWMWASCGRLYYLIKEPDLRHGNFAATWLVMHST